MFENWAGDSEDLAIGLAYAWKLALYQQTPNGKTLQWLKKGHHQSSTTIDIYKGRILVHR